MTAEVGQSGTREERAGLGRDLVVLCLAQIVALAAVIALGSVPRGAH